MQYRLGLYEKAMPNSLSLLEKLMVAKDAGYDYLEMSIDETDEKLARLDAGTADIKKAMDTAGMPIGSICLSGHRKYPLGSNDPATEQRGIAILEKTIVLAGALGVRIIQLAGYDVYYEEASEGTEARFLRNLRNGVRFASRYGVLLGFETMETAFMNNVQKAMRYVSEVNSPYLGVYPDVGNCMNAALTYGEDALDDFRIGTGHIIAVHLKESLPGVFREVPFGTGHVDFNGIIRAALAEGVGMFVTEFWQVDDHWRQAITDAKAFFDDKFAAAASCLAQGVSV